MLMHAPNPLAPAALRAGVAESLLWACRLDVEALKPGNVGLHGGGHGMTAADFTASAEAAAPPLADPALALGRAIRLAIEASVHAAGCNTNLGIVLLAAPLAHAAFRAADSGAADRGDFAGALREILATTTVADAEDVYAAIRQARPAGLGQADRHDVARPATVTLRAAMAEAAGRDRIARQYATDYADVFARRALFRALASRWGDARWAASAVFLDFLASSPDSHIARKQGSALAQEVSAAARPLAERLAAADDPAALRLQLLAWDRALKARGANPGTSADLTVATAAAVRLEALLDTGFPARGPMFDPRAAQSRDAQSRILANQPKEEQ